MAAVSHSTQRRWRGLLVACAVAATLGVTAAVASANATATASVASTVHYSSVNAAASTS